jgi:hypothetical protein
MLKNIYAKPISTGFNFGLSLVTVKLKNSVSHEN